MPGKPPRRLVVSGLGIHSFSDESVIQVGVGACLLSDDPIQSLAAGAQ